MLVISWSCNSTQKFSFNSHVSNYLSPEAAAVEKKQTPMIIRLHLLEMWLELSMYISRRLFWLLYIRIYLWIYMLSHSLNSLPSLWCWIFLFYFFVKRFSNIFILAVFEPFFFSRVKLVFFIFLKLIDTASL